MAVSSDSSPPASIVPSTTAAMTVSSSSRAVRESRFGFYHERHPHFWERPGGRDCLRPCLSRNPEPSLGGRRPGIMVNISIIEVRGRVPAPASASGFGSKSPFHIVEIHDYLTRAVTVTLVKMGRCAHDVDHVRVGRIAVRDDDQGGRLREIAPSIHRGC